jgi:hypothetical protein
VNSISMVNDEDTAHASDDEGTAGQTVVVRYTVQQQPEQFTVPAAQCTVPAAQCTVPAAQCTSGTVYGAGGTVYYTRGHSGQDQRHIVLNRQGQRTHSRPASGGSREGVYLEDMVNLQSDATPVSVEALQTHPV